MTTSFKNIVYVIHAHYVDKITNRIMTCGTWAHNFNIEIKNNFQPLII